MYIILKVFDIFLKTPQILQPSADVEGMALP